MENEGEKGGGTCTVRKLSRPDCTHRVLLVWMVHRVPVARIMPNIVASIFGSGIIIGMQCTTSYIVDAYRIYATSAVAATTVLRATASFRT